MDLDNQCSCKAAPKTPQITVIGAHNGMPIQFSGSINLPEKVVGVMLCFILPQYPLKLGRKYVSEGCVVQF